MDVNYNIFVKIVQFTNKHSKSAIKFLSIFIFFSKSLSITKYMFGTTLV